MAVMAVVGFFLALSSVGFGRVRWLLGDWWVAALITALVILFCKRLGARIGAPRDRQGGLHAAVAIALAVVAAARIASSAPLILGAALMVPCGALFAHHSTGLRALVVLVALASAVAQLLLVRIIPPSSAIDAPTGWFVCLLRMALSIDLMLSQPLGDSRDSRGSQDKNKNAAAQRDDDDGFGADRPQDSATVWRAFAAAVVRAEGVLFAILLVLTLAFPPDLPRQFWLGMYAAIALPPALSDLKIAGRPSGIWGVFALAASTAIGLCAIKDESMELFLLASHCLLHLRAASARLGTPPHVAATTTTTNNNNAHRNNDAASTMANDGIKKGGEPRNVLRLFLPVLGHPKARTVPQ